MGKKEELLSQQFGVDLEEFNRQTGLSAQVYMRILKISVMNAEHLLTDLREAIDRGDMGKVHEIVHELKGVYANMRVNSLYELARDIDVFAHKGLWVPEMRPLADAFCEKFTQLKKILFSKPT